MNSKYKKYIKLVPRYLILSIFLGATYYGTLTEYYRIGSSYKQFDETKNWEQVVLNEGRKSYAQSGGPKYNKVWEAMSFYNVESTCEGYLLPF